MTAALLEAVAPRGAGRGRRLGRLGRGVRAAGDRPDHRGAPAAPAEPVRGLEGLLRPARPLLRRRARPARHPRPRVQPRRPGPGADLRDRELRAPVRRRARRRRGPDRDRHRQPGHAPRLHRRARRRPRLPDARRARRAGRVYNVCSGVSRSARELLVALGEVAGVAVDHQVDPAKVRAHEVFEIRGANDRLTATTGLAPGDPARADAARHPGVVARAGPVRRGTDRFSDATGFRPIAGAIGRHGRRPLLRS